MTKNSLSGIINIVIVEMWLTFGEMAERSKAYAWRAYERETAPWVQIPLSPPTLGA